MTFRAIIVVCAIAAFAASSPTWAQFEIEYPNTPPAEGQTLLEWSDPPILRYDIPEAQRGDVSACGTTFEYDLDRAALTCWPLLRAAQLFTVAEFTANETVGDKQTNLRKGIAYADETLAFIGEARWPLQEYLRTKSLELKVNSLMKLGEWSSALDASGKLIANINGDLFQFDEFRLAFAHRKHGQILLKLGRFEDAKLNLETARELLTGFEGDKIGLPFSDNSEDMIVYAIQRGELEYAQDVGWRYLDHVRRAPSGMQFGFNAHLDLMLYLAASRQDRDGALDLLKQRFARQRDYARCDKGYFNFPQMVSPLRMDREIVEVLAEGGCEAGQLAMLQTKAGQPIAGLGSRELPPLADTPQ